MTMTTTPGVLPVINLKDPSNWRAFFHQLVGVVVPLLVTFNLVSEQTVTAWVPFVFAIADNLLSVGNTTDRVRRAVYAAVGALQAGGLVTMLVANAAPDYVPITGAVLAVLTAFLARFYTPTTTVVPTSRAPDVPVNVAPENKPDKPSSRRLP